MSSRKDLRNNRTSGFHIPLSDADAVGFGGEKPPQMPNSVPMPPPSQAAQLRDENNALKGALEDLRQQLESRTSAMTIQDGTMFVHDFQFTPKGLVAPEHIDHQAWEEVGQLLFKLEGSLQWLIGDWLVYGEELKYGDTKKLAEIMGRDPQTFYDYANVARSVQFSLRNENLSFNHHRVIAKLKLEPYQQMQALTYAADQALSVANFRKWLTEGDTVEINQISEYKATVPLKRKSIFRQYREDIDRFSPDEPDQIETLQPNDCLEIARRAKWLADYYTALERTARSKASKKK